MTENHKRYVWCQDCDPTVWRVNGVTMGRCTRHKRMLWRQRILFVALVALWLAIMFWPRDSHAGEPFWAYSPDGTLAQFTQTVPKGFGVPRGSHLALTLGYRQIVGTVTSKNGTTLCTLQGTYTDCSIIEGCGLIGPALSSCE
jgi:hypothetical protein